MKRDDRGGLADLYRCGLLHKGEILVPRSKKYAAAEATIGENGVIWYNSSAYTYPSPAGMAVTGKSNNGWDFWHVFRDKQTGKHVPASLMQRHALLEGYSENMLEFLRDKMGVDVRNIEMVSLDELRNRLPQGFRTP